MVQAYMMDWFAIFDRASLARYMLRQRHCMFHCPSVRHKPELYCTIAKRWITQTPNNAAHVIQVAKHCVTN